MQVLQYMCYDTSMEELPNHKKPPVNQILQFLPMVCPLLYKQNAFYLVTCSMDTSNERQLSPKRTTPTRPRISDEFDLESSDDEN
ncbi:hypothetical protein NQ317_005762 [Molorchus minor]|uniref:Uncharacterized protein n=1 Tax=Molorchus minor TaxID=1323400 RepID=A0ABQ9JV15_9CUCU|nr:hypothetical protein NQ317_005762 [Molorchus minor]